MELASCHDSMNFEMTPIFNHCATSRKVAGSIHDDVIGIFHWHNPSGRTMAPWGWLRLWQKWVPGIFPGDKGGRCL